MKEIITAIKALILYTILAGVLYPLAVYFIAQIFYGDKANGSLIKTQNEIKGSIMIAQKFEGAGYFHPRPSATGYKTFPSGASNLGPTSLELKHKTDSLRNAYILENSLRPDTRVPEDAIFSSASGLDPHISPENAKLQAGRIIKARNLDKLQQKRLEALIEDCTEKPQMGLLGENRINVLILNMQIDKL